MSSAIRYTCAAYLFAMLTAIDGLLIPNEQAFYILWAIASVGMLACAVHSIFSE